MLKRLITITATTVMLAGGLTATAEAAPVQAVVSCHAHRSGNHWTCITPGSYCPAAAHRKIGYAKARYTHRRYRCSYYGSDGRWHWKRA